MNSQTQIRNSNTVFYRASKREIKSNLNKSTSVKKKSVISQNIKSKFKDTHQSQNQDKRKNKSENKRNSQMSHLTTSSNNNKNINNSSISNLDKLKKTNKNESSFIIKNKKITNSSFRQIKKELHSLYNQNNNNNNNNNNDHNQDSDNQVHYQYEQQIDVPNKFQRKDFDIYLSSKLKIKIFIVYFMNPSIYAYDSFLNSLIYISKFNKCQKISHSTHYINKQDFPKLDIKKSSICSFQHPVRETSNKINNLKSLSISMDKENNNFSESQSNNHPTDSINSNAYDINSNQRLSSNSEETVSSDNSNKFTEVIDFLENKLHQTNKIKEITKKKYKALNNSYQSFESKSINRNIRQIKFFIETKPK